MLEFGSSKIKYSFIISCIALTLMGLSSSIPIPFYSTYQSLYNIMDSVLSISTFFYFIGDVIGLIFLARLSDYFGRKPIMELTLITALFGSIVFIFINGSSLLVLGRLIQGISCGISVSSIQTYVLDVSPKNSHLGIILSANLPTFGFAIGSLFSGLFVDIYDYMFSWVFFIVIIMFLISIVLVFFCEETVGYKKFSLSYLKPKISIPNNIRPFILISIVLFISTYTLNGFYLTFSSSISLFYFNYSSKLVAAIVYTSVLIPQIFGSVLINRLGSRKGILYGLLIFAFSMIFVNISIIKNYFGLFLVFNVIAALFCGLCFTATMNNLLDKTSISNRAGVMATIYLMTDGGCALSNIIISSNVDYIGLVNVLLIYNLFLFIAFVFVFFSSKNLF